MTISIDKVALNKLLPFCMTKKLFLLLIVPFFACRLLAQNTLIDLESDRLFRDALELFDKKKYPVAQKIFAQYTSLGIHDEKHIQARYYESICALKSNNQDFESLVSNFIRDYPSHPRAFSALQQLGNYYFDKGDYQRALEYYQQIDTGPMNSEEDIESAYRTAYTFFMMGRYDRASPIFNQIKTKKGPYVAPASYYAGFISYRNGNYAQALGELERAEQDTRFRDNTRALKAAIFYKQKRYDDVLALASTPSEANQDELNLLVGECHFLKFDYVKALPFFEKYLARNPVPEDRAVNYRIGFTYLNQQQAQKSIDFLVRAAAAQDTLGQVASYHLGLAHLDLKNVAQASIAFNTARAMNFDQKVKELATYYYIKANFDMGAYSAAIEAAETYLKLFSRGSNLEEVYNLLGESYQYTGDFEKALDYFSRIQNKTPEVRRAFQRVAFNKAVVEFNDEKYRQAVASLRQSLAFPVDQQLVSAANFWLGETFSVGNLYDSALVYYNVVRTGSPSFARSLYGRGYAHFNLKNYAEAARNFDQFIKMPGNGQADRDMRIDAMLRLADCYYVLKRYDEALSFYDAALQNRSGDPDYIFFQRGMVNRNMSRLNDAVSNFERVVNSYPNSKFRDQALYQLAEINFDNGRREESLLLYSALIKDHPQSLLLPFAIAKRALAAQMLQRFDQSVADHKRILDEFIVNKALAETSIEALQKIQAEGYPVYDLNAYLQKFTAVYAESEVVIKSRFDIAKRPFDEANYGAAIASLNEFVRSNPVSQYTHEAYFMLGFSYEFIRDIPNALSNYRKVQGAFRERAVVRIAELEFASGNFQEAIVQYQELRKMTTNSRNVRIALLGLMRASFQIRDFEATNFYSNQIISEKLTRDFNEAELFKGKVLLEQKNYLEALGQFQKVVRMGSDRNAAEAQFLIGRTLREQGQFATSIDELIKVRANHESHMEWILEAFLLIAENYISLNNNFQARATLNSIVEVANDEAVRERARKRLAEI